MGEEEKDPTATEAAPSEPVKEGEGSDSAAA